MLRNSKGAYKVPIGGSTPLGLPKGMFLFKKGKNNERWKTKSKYKSWAKSKYRD
jgi:hypothetical protein